MELGKGDERGIHARDQGGVFMAKCYLRSSRFMAWHTINVAVVVAGAGDVFRFTHVPGYISLDGENESKEKRNGGELHCSIFVM